MSFFLLDNESELFLQKLLDEFNKYKNAERALSRAIRSAKRKDEAWRIVEHLCSKGYMKKEKRSYTDASTKKKESYDHYDISHSGVRYFDDKEEYLKGKKQVFKKLPTNSKNLLQKILDADNPSAMLQESLQNCSIKEDDQLRSMIKELIDEDYIKVFWADNIPWQVSINNSARTYSEREAEYERQLKLSSGPIYNIGSITAQGSNVVLGDVINSSLNINNAIQKIESEIEQKGAEDKQALYDILEEAKELIDNINDSRKIPKNKGFFSRLTSHFEKHSWFYTEIVSLLGTAALTLIQG